MSYRTLEVEKDNSILTVTFNRISHRNSISSELLEEFSDVLNRAIVDEDLRVLLNQGKQGYFCTGMDFTQIVNGSDTSNLQSYQLTKTYMDTLHKLSHMQLVTIAYVDGQVMAGGVGIVAACDYAVATPQSRFSLSEALWGLMPSMVIPYLARKVGYHKAKSMTLSTLPITGEEAQVYQLVDKVSDAPSQEIRHLCSRITRLKKSTIGNIKTYFNRLFEVTSEVEELAMTTTSNLFRDEEVLRNIENYVKYKIFPWEER